MKTKRTKITFPITHLSPSRTLWYTITKMPKRIFCGSEVIEGTKSTWDSFRSLVIRFSSGFWLIGSFLGFSMIELTPGSLVMGSSLGPKVVGSSFESSDSALSKVLNDRVFFRSLSDKALLSVLSDRLFFRVLSDNFLSWVLSLLFLVCCCFFFLKKRKKTYHYFFLIKNRRSVSHCIFK